MTKSDFVDKVADTSGLSKKDAGSAVDAVLKSIEDALRTGDEVSFTGFGKFHVADRGEPGCAVHLRLGDQQGDQVAGAGRRFVGRRRSVARNPVRRPPRGGRRRARVPAGAGDRSGPVEAVAR